MRSDTAIRRHWELVNCAFCFCWLHDPLDGGEQAGPTPPAPPSWLAQLRRVRAWLAPLYLLARVWRGWSAGPLPAELKTLTTALTAGHGISLYTPP